MKRFISLSLVLAILAMTVVLIPVSAAVKKPVINSISNTATGVKLNWNKVAGAKKYRVFVKEGSRWKTLGVTSSTSWTNNSVQSGKKYTYTVRCVAADGKTFTSDYNRSGWSILFLSAPTGLQTTGTDRITLSWKRVNGATQYKVERSTGSKWSTISTTKNNSISIGADDNVCYHFRVTALAQNDNAFSAPSKTHTCSYAFYYKNAAPHIWTTLIKNGYSKASAAGILGNIMAECGNNSFNLRPSLYGGYGSQSFYGLCMWNIQANPELKNKSLNTQINYLIKDMPMLFKTTAKNYQKDFSFEKFKKLNNEKAAAKAFAICYIRITSNSNSIYQRQKNATAALNKYK